MRCIETADKHQAELTTNGSDHAQEHHAPPPSHPPPPTPSPASKENNNTVEMSGVSNMPAIKSKSDTSIPPRGITIFVDMVV